MIPYRDENRVRGFPLATYALIIINVAMFVQELSVAGTRGDAGLERYLRTLGLVPYNVTHGIHLPSSPNPEALTLVTALFLHAGLLHIAGNMLYLFVFGPDIEYLTGPFRFAIFYLACGVAAGLAQIAWAPNSHIVAIGASGAIAGVLGAFMIFFGGNTIDAVLPIGCFPLLLRVPAAIVIGIWIVEQVYLVRSESAVSGGVGYLEHVVGFVSGAILIFLFKVRSAPRAWSG